jgi:hypothetical protein
MIIKNKRTGELIKLSNGAYEVGDAFIDPLRCFYKEYYELVNKNNSNNVKEDK